MGKRVCFFVPLMVAVLILSQLVGCSVIGLVGGAMSDANKPDEYVFAPSELDTLEQGSTVRVLKTDSTIVFGEYEKSEAVPSGKYIQRYEQFLEWLPSGTWMPSLGDSLRIFTNVRFGGATFEGELLGFDQGIVRIHRTAPKTPVGLRAEAVDSLSKGTTTLSGDVLRLHLNKGGIPSMKALIVTNERGAQRIFVDDILEVHQEVSKNAALTYFLVGAAIDVAALLWACSSLSKGTKKGWLKF